MLSSLKLFYENHEAEILNWLSQKESQADIPLYTSVDIRNSGAKIAVVDTNLFPAGFNNLCLKENDKTASVLFKKEIQKRVPNCKNILLIIEEHTRNKWYLENARILEKIMVQSGFSTRIATFSTEPVQKLETATGFFLDVYSVDYITDKIRSGELTFEIIILNNDLINGIPESLLNLKLPIFPSPQLGWHSRLKSQHFKCANAIIAKFCDHFNIDPWLLSAEFVAVPDVDIQNESDRNRLYVHAKILLDKIAVHYERHNIKDEPLIFLKADSGTYGMGVLPITNPEEILSLNRKDRNKLSVGKSSSKIQHFLLQEGVPSIYQTRELVGEMCIYQISNQFLGAFYRVNTQKGARENLNSTGMSFVKFCPDLPVQSRAFPTDDTTFKLYQLLSRLAGLAAVCESTLLTLLKD